uniref:AAA family ATPase n=1 Tax=Faecalibacterium prausnitzii TaxID=853 RepID=UPI0040250B21
CRTEQQLFSRLTFAVMFHQTDPDAREDLLDDVRGAACSMQLPAVNYKIDQWLNTCKQAWQADPAAFMAAVNTDAKQRKLALEGSAAQPGLLADVPMQSVAWLVPQLLPLGEVSLLGADGGTGKGIWQAQLIAYVTAGRTSGFFPQPPEKTGSVLLFSGEDDPGKVLKARLTAAGADMSRVMVVTSDAYFARTGSPLCIPDTSFAKYVGKAAPALVIIDPLQSFLPAGVEMASRNQMRSALLPLKALCAKHGCAALISMHTNKRANVSGRARLADSSDIWDIARSVLMMGRDKNSEKLYLSHEKSSYSAPARTALLHIEQAQVEGVKTAVAVFDSRTDKKDADFVEERRVRTAQTKEDTAQAILNVLAESKLGSMPNTQLRAEVMKEMGCSDRTYIRAYGNLIKSGEIIKKNIRQQDGKNQWYSFLYCSETSGKVPIN